MTSDIETAAGIGPRGCTGLTDVMVAVLFLTTSFFAPRAKSVPTHTTAPALRFIACLMAPGFSELGRCHRICAGRSRRSRRAADLLNRQRHRLAAHAGAKQIRRFLAPTAIFIVKYAGF
jgi:hypothetical protein